jgi:uncharacterized protein YprB with RNaseH-like and TPR domain
LYALALEDTKPEQPEVLYILRQSRLFNIPVFNGAYHDWPYLARLEIMCCINAENEYDAIKEVNQRLALNSARKKAEADG